MGIFHKVTVSTVKVGFDPASIEVKATIRTYRESFFFWNELVSEETKHLSFIYSEKSWYQIIDNEPVKCEYRVQTHPGSFSESRLSTLWNDENDLVKAKKVLKRLQKKHE